MILIPLLAFLVKPLKRAWQRRQEKRAEAVTERAAGAA
jgi:hypothetical protein